jgi:hypothetical protein
MSSVTPPAGLIHLGMDTSKNTIVVAVLMPGEETPVIDRVFNDEEAVRRLVGRFADRALLRACYEAGPGGYDLYRLLSSMGVACEVVAPSLIPKGASDKVKTDPLTELPEGIQQLSGRMGILVATVADHDHRRRCAAGPVPAGDAAGRVA